MERLVRKRWLTMATASRSIPTTELALLYWNRSSKCTPLVDRASNRRRPVSRWHTAAAVMHGARECMLRRYQERRADLLGALAGLGDEFLSGRTLDG